MNSITLTVMDGIIVRSLPNGFALEVARPMIPRVAALFGWPARDQKLVREDRELLANITDAIQQVAVRS